MNRQAFLALFILLAGATSAAAQDVVTIGAGTGPSGGLVSVPLWVRDISGTPLGSDVAAGNRIQGFAFKVTFPTEIVASVTFARAGITAFATPLYETTLQGSGFGSFVASFRESSDPIAFTSDAAAPGNQIGTLTVSLQPAAPAGATAVLTIHPASAVLSNQAGTVRETVANGNLALVNGSVAVSAGSSLAAPAGLDASADTTSQVNANWTAVNDANHYEVWRSFNGGAFALIGTASGTSFPDSSVAALTTYLYRVRAVDSGGGASPFSNVDPATTILFTDDPLAMNTTPIKAIHAIELRTAVNAMRAAAKLPPLGADATVAAGSPVRAQHIDDLRAALAGARSAAGLAAITLTDSVLSPGATPVRAAHVQELRNGVK